MSRRDRGFTLIELLVVISIIVILAGIMVVWVSQVWQIADSVKCKSNVRQIGMEIIRESLQGAYPAGGSSPGEWATACGTVQSALRNSTITMCPAVKSGPATNPASWATCSYAYFGGLTPTYTCKCSACGTDPGKKIWSLYWAGVDYTGSHNQANDSSLRTFNLSDSLVFTRASVDSGEPTTQPTIPDHQDMEKITTNDKPKYRTQRALRELPETPEDASPNLPLLMDIAALRCSTSNYPTSVYNGHISFVTESNKSSVLSTNHCVGTAVTKRNWGINIFYANGAVEWKDWTRLRFQVMVKGVGGDANARYLYYY